MSDGQAENKEILFQYIMNSRAYRRGMIPTRVILTLIVSGGLAGICAVNIPIGISVALIALFVGAILVIVGFTEDWSYTVFNTKLMIKNKDKRYDVPLDRVVAVSYKRAFYEKDLMTGTVTVTAKTAKGGKRKYRLKHVFDAQDGVAFLKEIAAKNNAGKNDKPQ